MVYDVEHVFVFDYLYIFFWLSVCSDLYSFFMGLFKRSLSILSPNPLSYINFANTSLPVCGLSFDFLNKVF